ncbi:VENN motif pre-toxin domain-containing protein, partial [Collimonas silvisoli]|uniref:VENN motif pre-toxin domain-containing protein n=1 Tax=Collimonas silvisoli TaxID=2825884 RepID=UPI001B8B1F17
GILVGGVAGQGAGQLAANASAPYVANAIGDYFAQPGHENQTAQVLTHAVLGAILAAANGGSAAAGAGAGASGELAAQVLSRELYPQAYDADGSFHPDRLNANQINTVIALSTGVGALVAGATGGTALDASVGGSIAANAATNNWLSPKGNVIRNVAKSACDNGDTKACDVVTAFDNVDKSTKKQLDDLVASCNGGKGSAADCTQAGQIIAARNQIAKQDIQSCPAPYNCLAQYQSSANENSSAYGPGIPGWGNGATTPTADPITAAVLIRMGLLAPKIALASAVGGGGAEFINQVLYGSDSYDLERIANASILSWASGGLGATLKSVYTVAGLGAATSGATTVYNNSQSGSHDSILGTALLGWMFAGTGKVVGDAAGNYLNGTLNYKPYVVDSNLAALLQRAAGTPVPVVPTNSLPFLVKDVGGAVLPGTSGFVKTPETPVSKK